MDAPHKSAPDPRAGAFPSAGASRLVKQPIGTDWSLIIDKAFTRQVAEGDVVLSMPGRTIYCSVFNTNNAAAEEAIEKMIEGRPGIPVQMFDREEPGLCGHAYLLPEGEGNNRYWGLNAWTAARGSVCCTTIYFRDIVELDWAIQVWKSVRPGRETKGRLN
ncbi:MAG: hypothetical protein JWN24_1000 [Phycisphaerales bacterium]|nr:hypothetical protein [Phycisphaerales bacterium]